MHIMMIRDIFIKKEYSLIRNTIKRRINWTD